MRSSVFSRRSTVHRAAGAAIVEMMEKRLFMSGTLLTGSVIGTAGSYKNRGTVVSNAFDGNLNTYFDAPAASGSYAGLDLGSAHAISQISYAPRAGWAGRMVGGVFQGSDTADFSSGVATLFTVPSTPAAGVYTTAAVSNPGSFEFVRYLGPANSYCDVADIQFFAPSTSSAVTLSADGTLSINGSAASDNITVGFSPNATPQMVLVTLNGNSQTFNWASVTSMIVDSGDGSDTIRVSGTALDAPDYPGITILAGNGNDDIYENLNTDTSTTRDPASVYIKSGNGNSTIEIDGSSENVTVLAGNGNDLFLTNIYGEGNLNASIYAGDGNDKLAAGTVGADGSQYVTFNAGIGNDTISNSDIDDHVSGMLGGQVYVSNWQADYQLGKVYADTNGNGSYQIGEPTVANAPVNVANGSGYALTSTTDASGNYSVLLEAGETNIPDLGQTISGVNFALQQPLAGANFGTAGSYKNDGDTFNNAFDGNLGTYFDGPGANGNDAGRDLGVPTPITSIAYAPRSGWTNRMVGGIFQGANSANFADAVTLFTVTSAPASGVLNYQPVSVPGTYRYVRYLSPNGSYGNIAEAQFFSTAMPYAGASLSSNGLLTVTGTSGADTISVSINDQAPGDGSEVITVSVNRVVQSIDARLVHGIVVNSGNGNDTIAISGSYEVITGSTGGTPFDPTADLATTVNTGSGNDSITAGVFTTSGSYEGPPDVINLGSGNDTVQMDQDGTSTVNGGAGTDDIFGEAVDGLELHVFGGSGDDIVRGGAFTNDFFHGGTGTNTYVEGPDYYNTGGILVNLNGPYLSNIQNYIDTAEQNVTVVGGDGSGEIFIDAGGANVSVTGGNGNDLIQVYDAAIAHITTGSGNNSVYLRSDGGNATITGGSGNDTINSADGSEVTMINGGGGINTAYTKSGDTVTNIQTLNPRQGVLLTGKLLATTGSYQNNGNTAAKAVDGNVATYYDGAAANGNYVGLDLGSYQRIGSISFAPRTGWAQRMVGGVFQTSDSPTFTFATNIYTITSVPATGTLTTIPLPEATFGRYIRYLAPDGSFGNVAEIQFRTAGISGPVQFTGTVIGTPGSYRSQGNGIANVFDSNVSTFFDAPAATGAWVGLDLGSAKVVTQVKYAPRTSLESRMIGGQIQASNFADFSTGVVTLYTISSAPVTGTLTTAPLSNSLAYRYYRYFGPANSFCNISELEFDG